MRRETGPSELCRIGWNRIPISSVAISSAGPSLITPERLAPDLIPLARFGRGLAPGQVNWLAGEGSSGITDAQRIRGVLAVIFNQPIVSLVHGRRAMLQ